MKKNPMMTTQFLEQCTTTVIGNLTRMKFIGLSYPEHKIKDCNSGKRSHMQSSYTVRCQQIASKSNLSKNGDRILFERISIPRPTPKVTLKSNWHSQQQQQQQQSFCDDVSTSTKRLVRDSHSGTRDVRGYTTDDHISTRRLVQDPEPAVGKKPQVEIDLRVEEVSPRCYLSR